MSDYPLVPLGEVLTPSHDVIPVDPTEEYPLAGIFSFGKGDSFSWRFSAR